MRKMVTILFLLVFSAIINLNAQNKAPDTPVFSGDPVKFSDYPGIFFRVSKPFMRYQQWDTEHTGEPDFAIALELNNQSDKSITAMSFNVKLYDKSGKVIYEGTSNSGPFSFEPKSGNVFKPGYKGVDVFFIARDKSVYDKFGKIDFKLTELKTASASLTDKPVFEDTSLTFPDFPGLEFFVSKPYTFLDSMSGDELFAIALKFNNNSKKPVRFMYFNVTIYDDKGPIFEQQDIQEHNQRMNPPAKNFYDEYFPENYTGIDNAFYINEDLSLLKKFKMIKVVLTKVEY